LERLLTFTRKCQVEDFTDLICFYCSIKSLHLILIEVVDTISQTNIIFLRSPRLNVKLSFQNVSCNIQKMLECCVWLKVLLMEPLVGTSNGAGTGYPSRAPKCTQGFSGVRVARSLVFCIRVLKIVVCPFVHFLLVIVLSVLLRFTDSA
jgi:hypothetical protein